MGPKKELWLSGDPFRAYLFSVCECFSSMYVRTAFPGGHGSQEKALDPLELELQTVVICHEGARN